jgi:hypothetical protein
LDPARLAEAVVEMPAMKSMNKEKADTFFGFAEEMMIDKQNKPPRKGLAEPADGFQSPAFPIGAGNASLVAEHENSGHGLSVGAILESAFLNNGVFPGTMVLSREDVDFLANILEGMGLSRAEVSTLFQSMKEIRSERQVTLAHFLKDLSAFEQLKIQVPGAGITKGRQPDSLTFQRMESGLEKLSLSVRNKENHLPDTLGTFHQALEKNVRETTSGPKSIPMNSAHLGQAVLAMPAIRSMKMEHPAINFGFVREMMINKQNKAIVKDSVTQNGKSQNLLSPREDGGLRGQQKADRWISEFNIIGKEVSLKLDGNRRSVQTSASNQELEKQIMGHKTAMQSRPMASDVKKQDTKNGSVFHKAIADALPMRGDGFKTDETGLHETHQNLMPGGERFQSAGVSNTGAPDHLSASVKQTAVFQHNPLPAAVVNQVGREIAAFLQRGERIFTLQLKPPELGLVNIEMDVKENVLKMSVVTETSSAKDMLHTNYVDLKRVLEGYGIRVETFDVQLSSNLNQNSSNWDGFLNQQNHSHGRFGKMAHSGRPGTDKASDGRIEPPVSWETNNESLLDLLA